ncbi:MAG: hypothetical protein HY350_01270 [Candidatus Omnitrophica bacterium]|nr:hypothetical protein [Candidatus Omnitrophota bacterium]
MYNWSVDERYLKRDKLKYTIWKIEQMINFGLGGEKLNSKELKKYWKNLYLDPVKKRYLEFLLWHKR